MRGRGTEVRKALFLLLDRGGRWVDEWFIIMLDMFDDWIKYGVMCAYRSFVVFVH
jgi:hypothetical protein